jgi:hypothetical protein
MIKVIRWITVVAWASAFVLWIALAYLWVPFWVLLWFVAWYIILGVALIGWVLSPLEGGKG